MKIKKIVNLILATGITDKYNSYKNNVITADRYWNNL